VNLVYRHGDRSPIQTFPKDIYQEEFWPRGFGQLSKKGQLQHFHLGLFLRRRYNSLLGTYYKPKDIYVQSTDVDRTLMSAEANLAGLFSPHSNESWSTSVLGWQPIPVHTVPKEQDIVLQRAFNCSRYPNMIHELWNTKPVTEVKNLMKYKRMLDIVRKGTGDNSSLQQLWYISDTILIEHLYNLTMPKWMIPGILELMDVYNSLGKQLMVYNTTLARLAGGNLLNKIRSNMVDKMNDTVKIHVPKMYMYSAHDDTVTILLGALGVFNNIAPPFASCVFIELWEDEGNEAFVKVLYRNDTSLVPKEPLTLTIPGCQEKCNWSRFVNITNRLISADYKGECALLPGMEQKKRMRDSENPVYSDF